MATDMERSETVGSFERISRTTGTIFKYALLGATLFGILSLGVLLVYVANDAIQPLTADPGWFLVFFLALVVPTVVVCWYLNQREDSLAVGVTALGIAAVGTLFGAGLSSVFIDVISPLTLLAYFLALFVSLAISIGLSRINTDLPFLGWFGITILAFVASFTFIPGIVLGFPYVPTAGIAMGIVSGSLVALAARMYVGNRWDGDRVRDIAATVALLATVAAAPVGQLVGIGSVPAALLIAMAGIPLGLYVADTVVHRPTDRIGLVLPAVIVGGALLGALIVDLVGFAGPKSWLDWQFLITNVSTDPEDAGMYPAIVGSVLLMFVVAVASFPLGVGTAVYLEEYAPDNRLTRVLKINISNLAGVPSVVYGLLGAGLFVTYLGPGIPVLPPGVANLLGLSPIFVAGNLFGSGTIVVGGLTLSLLILPIIIISSQEAIRSVPDDMREASYGMGATRWQTVKNVVLPRAFPGILTGTILGLGRAIGETAPLIMIGAAHIADLPRSFDSVVAAMPMQIFAYASTLATDEFYNRVVPAAVIVLLVAMLAMNSVAIALRNRYQRER